MAIVIIATGTRIIGDRWSSGVLGLFDLTVILCLVWFIVRRRRNDEDPDA